MCSGMKAGIDPSRSGLGLRDMREAHVPAPPERAFEPIRRIGGANGWYCGDMLWRLRGAIDAILGGVGLRKGRRDPERLRVGDTVDCWRVEAYEPDRRLLLKLELKIPGSGWLEFEVSPNAEGSIIRQTATLVPNGFWGRMYWYVEYPFHHYLFPGMLKSIVERSTDHG